ncbi:MAG: DUF819 family protein [Candidatus Neomarinimicrobiota bacterium]|nr:MAG: DUF819 family protein [Candidatus Neomarinimicrobiota bacterium]
MIHDNFGILAILLTIPAVIFLSQQIPLVQRFFKVVPPLVFAYFIPSLLSNLGMIPRSAEIYTSIKTFLLPASLLLLTLAVDIRGILRLGPKAGLLFLAGTAGVVLGGPVALWLFRSHLAPEIWKGMAALSGSWIGGGANFIAIGKAVGAGDDVLGKMVIVDVIVAYTWTGILLFLAGRAGTIDGKTGADTSAIEDLQERVSHFQESTSRNPTTTDWMVLTAVAALGSYLSYRIGNGLPELGSVLSHSTWRVITVTTIGVLLSFTPAKSLEGIGASRLGTVFLYLLIGVIGANADFTALGEVPWLLAAALVWIVIHILVLFLVLRLVRAPLFFLAVGSQANIGGAASAPIVAAAFHPALASVGVMLGIAGYVLGTYAALICAALLQWVA